MEPALWSPTRLTGADASGAVLSLGGTDASAFSLSSGGDLTFRSSPNFESPADQGSDNTYNVTISARSGDLSTSRIVTVNVTNVDEPGTVTVRSLGNEAQGRRGADRRVGRWR